MAESSERIDEELSETEGTLEGESTAKGRRGLPFWVILGVAALVATGFGGYLSFAYYENIAQSVGSGWSDDSTSGTGDEKARVFGQFSELDGVIINPAGSDGKRFLMLNIGLEAAKLETLEEVTEKEVVVRDTVLKVLGSQTVEVLSDITRRNELKESVRTAVNSVLRKGEIERLYFTRYVLQ